MQVLVIGATGYIGSHLYKRMKEKKISVVGTSCKGENGFIKFKLGIDGVDTIVKELTDVDKTAIICAAITNIDTCRKEYKTAYEVNVIATKSLIDRLYWAGFKIIYLSSDNVFDGEKGNYSEYDAVNPINAYGHMKVEIERYLQKNIPKSCIFRLAKVVDIEKSEKNLFFKWEQLYNRPMCCFKHNVLTCIAMEDVVNACVLAMQLELTGIYHLASDKAIKRNILMKQFFESLNINNYNIEVKSIDDFGLLERRPLNTSLNNYKFKCVADYRFLSMEELIAKYVASRDGSMKKRCNIQEK